MSGIAGTEAGSITDGDLLERIQQRDTEALASLYDRFSRPAFALAFRMLSNREGAEEVVQDAFVSVWRQAATFDNRRGDVRPWLLSIVHHRAIDRLRRADQKMRPATLDEAWMHPSTADVFGDVHRGLQREEINRALDQLPSEQRQAIDLAYFGARSFVEISEMTGAPVGTIKSRVRLGLAKLRTVLSEEVR